MLGLEFLLRQNNIQYKDFAEQLGVSKQIVSIWINGTRKISKHHIPKICEMLNTTEEFLIGTIDKDFREDVFKKVADNYKDKIPDRLYNALYNRKIEITD